MLEKEFEVESKKILHIGKKNLVQINFTFLMQMDLVVKSTINYYQTLVIVTKS